MTGRRRRRGELQHRVQRVDRRLPRVMAADEGPERLQHGVVGHGATSPRFPPTSGSSSPMAPGSICRAANSAATPSAPILSSLSSAMSASPWRSAPTPAVSSIAVSRRRSFSRIDEVLEAQLVEHLGDRRQHLDLDDRRGRADGVDVALVELAEAAPGRPVGTPDRLNLVPLEELRQLRLVLGHHPRQRHGQVVPQGQIRRAARLVLAALEDLEDQLVAFLAVLPEQRLDVLDRRRLQRLEAIALVHAADHADHVLAPAHVLREEVAHAARRLGAHAGNGHGFM